MSEEQERNEVRPLRDPAADPNHVCADRANLRKDSAGQTGSEPRAAEMKAEKLVDELKGEMRDIFTQLSGEIRTMTRQGADRDEKLAEQIAALIADRDANLLARFEEQHAKVLEQVEYVGIRVEALTRLLGWVPRE